jgi:uncharacterized protein YlxP (DUF503 family)
MVVGVLQLDLSIPDARSLKDKRSTIKSIKDRLGVRHNVSVAEVDYLDEHQRCMMAVAMVANNRRFIDECLSKIVDEVRLARSAVLLNYEMELF